MRPAVTVERLASELMKLNRKILVAALKDLIFPFAPNHVK